MKTIGKTILVVVVLAAVGYGAFRVWKIIEERKQASTETAKKRISPNVVARQVHSGTILHSIWVTGEVRPLAEVDVVPKVVGRLDRLKLPDEKPIEEGTQVQQGQVLAVLEHDALEAAVQAATASMKVAEASRERAEVALVDAEREKKRWEALYREGSSTERQRDQAVANYDRSTAEVKLADAQVAQAEAGLRQARVILEEATIEAPITGIVSRKFVDEGDMVGPTTAILRIVRMDTVKVVGGVAERYLASLVPGKTAVKLAVDAYATEKFDGVVYRVGPGVEKLTRTVEIEARLSNADLRLKPGMFARIELVLERKENATVVPDEALIRQGPEVFVYVLASSKAQRRVLKLGISEGTQHEVLEGLKPGEQVVVRGQQLLQDGAEVTVVKEEP